MALMNEVVKPAHAVGLHFSVWGVVGWVIGAVAVSLLVVFLVLPSVTKLKSVVTGGKTVTKDVTLADQAGMGSLGIGWL